jgi:hypothetical protein
MKRHSILLLFAVAATWVGCEPTVSPGIEGKWVMQKGGFMGYALSLDASGEYTRWFWSDMVISSEIPEDPKKGTYRINDGWVTIPVTIRYQDGRSYVHNDRFKRETINGVEVLLREDAEAIWRRSGLLAGGVLIKVSDDPDYVDADHEPQTKRLFRKGVKEWSPEAEEAAKNG